MSSHSSTVSSMPAAIGVFDSGVGGLSILDKVHQLLPAENLLYFADSSHAPYGEKDEALIQQRCKSIMEFFIQKEVKAVVLACNTATATAVAMLREEYNLPIIGMEPAIKPAAEQSRAGIVGVLATAGTIDSDKFINLQSQYSDKIEIITKACPGLVEQIEQVKPSRDAIISLLQKFALPLVEKGADTLVLGCTHYSLITDLITDVVGSEVQIIDTGFAVAEELKRRLGEIELLNVDGVAGVEFYSTGDIEEQAELMACYWQGDIKVFCA